MQPASKPPNDILRLMLDSSGMSAYRLSLDLGRTRNWALNSFGRDPKLSTVAEVAEATGHMVAVLDATTGEAIAIVEPPKETKSQGQGEAKAKPKAKREPEDRAKPEARGEAKG